MNKTFILIGLLILTNCSSINDKADIKESANYYTANRDFENVPNQISIKDLELIIKELPYKFLDEYCPETNQDSIAFELLKDTLVSSGLNIQDLYIEEVNNINDTAILFYLNHVDYLVYKFNWELTNKEIENQKTKDKYGRSIPPIVGNVSGYEGWYVVNIVKKEVNIGYSR